MAIDTKNAVNLIKKGTISISTEKKKDNQFIVSVKDIGSDIDPEILAQIVF